MGLAQCIARENLKAGTVILPHSVAHPIQHFDLIGRVLAQDVEAGDTITGRYLDADDHLLCTFAHFDALDQLVALDQHSS